MSLVEAKNVHFSYPAKKDALNGVSFKIEEGDLLVKAIAEILQIDKDNKDFKNIDTIKNEELSSFEFERKLADIESKIYTFKSENTKINKKANKSQ